MSPGLASAGAVTSGPRQVVPDDVGGRDVGEDGRRDAALAVLGRGHHGGGGGPSLRDDVDGQLDRRSDEDGAREHGGRGPNGLLREALRNRDDRLREHLGALDDLTFVGPGEAGLADEPVAVGLDVEQLEEPRERPLRLIGLRGHGMTPLPLSDVPLSSLGLPKLAAKHTTDSRETVTSFSWPGAERPSPVSRRGARAPCRPMPGRSTRNRAPPRFMRSALSILGETGRADFTVLEVVERSKTSLRSFYQHFSSKDELLLALIEKIMSESTLRWRADTDDLGAAEALLVLIEKVSAPASSTTQDSINRGLTFYNDHLAETVPAEYARVLAPVKVLIGDIIDRGIAEGVFAPDLDVDASATLIMQSAMGAMRLRVLGAELNGTPLEGKHIYDFCLRALRK
jgi:AcrR family transcriptional regulator